MVAPVRYYLGAVLVYVLVASFTGLPGFEGARVPLDGAAGDALAGYLEFLSSHLKLVTIASAPIMALLFHRAFRQQGYDLAETFAFTLFANGHVTLAMSLLVPLMVRARHPAASAIVSFGAMGLSILYLSWAARRFYGDTPAWSLVKTTAVYAGYTAFIMLTMLLMLGAALALSG